MSHVTPTPRKEKRLESGGKKTIDPEVIRDFAMDRENGLGLFFPESHCIFQAGRKIPATHRCVLKHRFITAARINELTQANPELIDDLKTGLKPHPIERFIGAKTEDGFKNLQIRMGLDLQGGMRAVFQADYETYLSRLKEKYDPKLVKLREKSSSLPGLRAGSGRPRPTCLRRRVRKL